MSNERSNPTLVFLDRVFATVPWDDLFPNSMLQASSSSISDHCPIILNTNMATPKFHQFRFENFWIKMNGFMKVVKAAWKPPPGLPPLSRLDWLLRNTARELQRWSQDMVGSVRLQLSMAKELIFRFDVAQESRQLSPLEQWFRRDLKLKCLGLPSLERSIARQRSRITWLSEGDANTKFFQIQARHRRRKNCITRLRRGDRIAYSHDEKSGLLYHYFTEILGTATDRTHSLNFSAIGVPTVDLSEIDGSFTEEEV